MAQQLRQNILIVEDDESLLTLYTKVLERAGYDVSSATASDEARQLLSQKRYDVMVTDLGAAGGMNIFKFLSAAVAGHEQMNILIITGYTPENVSLQAKKFGLNLMEKPFTPAELVHRISTLLSENAA
ncbi:MAG: response regulator [Terriglobales bacterium]